MHFLIQHIMSLPPPCKPCTDADWGSQFQWLSPCSKYHTIEYKFNLQQPRQFYTRTITACSLSVSALNHCCNFEGWLTETLDYFTWSWQGAGCDTLRPDGRGTLQQKVCVVVIALRRVTTHVPMATLMSPRMMCVCVCVYVCDSTKPGQILHRAFYSSSSHDTSVI